MSKNDNVGADPARKKRASGGGGRGPLSQRTREVLALALAGFALFAMLSLATFRLADLDGPIPTGGMSNLGGAVGYHLAHGFTRSLGLAGWVPFAMLLAAAAGVFVGKPMARPTIKALGAVVFAAMLAILFAGGDGHAGRTATTPYGAGGVFGGVVSPRLEGGFGGTGRVLIVLFGAIMGLMIATEWLFSQLVARAVVALEALSRRLWKRPAAAIAGHGSLRDDDGDEPPTRSRRKATAAAAVAAADDDEDDVVGRDDDGDDDERGIVLPPARGRGSRTAAAVAKADGRAGAADDDVDGEAASDRERAAVAGRGAEADDGDADDGEAATPPRRRRRRAGDGDGNGGDASLAAPTDGAAAAAKGRSAAAAGDAAPLPAVAAAAPAEAPKAAPAEDPVVAQPAKPLVVLQPKPKPKPKPAPKPKPTAQQLPYEEYPFPSVELFQEPSYQDAAVTEESLQRNSQAIIDKLANFEIQAEVVAASVGPAVTQYELRLGADIRVNKITSFESDLAAALRAVSVRVVAPIPGKDTVGIEVPNAERQKVFMRELLDTFGRSEDSAIPLYLGKDVAGNAIVEDLAKMPHLLIAGTTGSGKSVCINTILLSILMTRTPEQVKLILVDPKMVELQSYKRVPHLCCEVVTNMKKAAGVLQWAVDEMENRYALLAAVGVNHIRNYNRLGQQELAKRLQREPEPDRVKLPYVVIVIDEFADLMAVAQNEVEEHIQRLAQKSRAVGMHVILATQRPSSEVITGIIKSNLPTQICFRVSRKLDSRIVLDVNGAEKLLGHGDMLYMPPGGGALLRAQGTFVTDDEKDKVIAFLEERGQQPRYTPELMQTQSSSRPKVADRDELYRQAAEVVLQSQRGSATLLQRALAVGYTRATRLLEMMEEDGLVGAFVGSKSRDVLMTWDEYLAREEQADGAADEQTADDGAAEDAAADAPAGAAAGGGGDGAAAAADEDATDGDALAGSGPVAVGAGASDDGDDRGGAPDGDDPPFVPDGRSATE
ncbi:MAG: DNA translocase FtsK 4TM domain-containing protein [Planctomycetota bacterium]